MGASLGLSWGILGLSWGLLGASWEPLGGLLGPLGGALLRTLNFDQFWIAFRSLLGTSWHPKGNPKGTQNGAQEAPKSSTVFDIEKVPLQDRLGAILGPSWGVLEAIFRSKNLQKPLGFPCFLAGTAFSQKMRLKSHLGPNLGQLGDPKGAKRHPQKAPKRTKNGYQK